MPKDISAIYKHLHIIRGRLLLLALILGAYTTILQPQIAKAHGGVVMDGGFTSDYEWIVLANPPLVEGTNLMSLVIYDINTYAPIDGMRVEVLIAHQSSKVTCCNPDDHVGPIELEADPENWPGDYSYELPLDGFGKFEIKFIAYEGDSEEPAIEVISQFLVLPDLNKITPEPNPNAQPGSESASPIQPPQSPLNTPAQSEPITATKSAPSASTATSPAVVDNPKSTEKAPTSSGGTPGSGGTTAEVSSTEGETILDKLRSQWMLWTAAGLIPLALLAFLLFRPSMDELIAQKEAELVGETVEEAVEEDLLDD